MIDLTFEEYVNKNFKDAIKELGIVDTKSVFLSEYYKFIKESLKNGNKMTKRVYDSIPDFHYFINHEYLIHGINVIV